MTATEKPNLTLYGIETQLLELLNYRESVESDPDMTAQEQQESLKACDESIAQYIRAEVKKADGIALYLREFEMRAEALEIESKRLQRKADDWWRRHENLTNMVVDVMKATKQTRIDGRHSVLQLKKNPPSVEVAQPELVPDDLQRVTVKMTLDQWFEVRRVLVHNQALAHQLDIGKHTEPMKSEIAKRLKEVEMCPKCKGIGAPWNNSASVPCDTCSGTGKVSAGVPGCRLSQSLRLEVR